jgi:hypothetical protein
MLARQYTSIYTSMHASSFLTSFPALNTFNPQLILQLARDSGFVLRTPRKIQPFAFLGSCLMALNSGSPHLRLQSIFAGLLANTTLSKQALHKRMGEASARFMQKVLAHLLIRQICVKKISHSFHRILIADSTCVALPQSHRALFPGPTNARVHSACARIQCLFDLISEQFLDFKISPFTRNDQAASGDIIPFLQPLDLVLRDLGYFSLKIFSKIASSGAFFLSRWRYGVCLIDPKTHQPVDLLRLLNRQASTDILLLLGKEELLPVRLLAFPLPQQIADAKRRKANKDRDLRVNHSKAYMALLSWNIFITNADQKSLPDQQVPALYRFRWQVEILFKSWKSYLSLNSLTFVGIRQIKTMLCAHLILVLLLHQSTPADRLGDPQSPPLSILKLAEFFDWVFPLLFFGSLKKNCSSITLINQINRHCTYEKRKRKNFRSLKKTFLS